MEPIGPLNRKRGGPEAPCGRPHLPNAAPAGASGPFSFNQSVLDSFLLRGYPGDVHGN